MADGPAVLSSQRCEPGSRNVQACAWPASAEKDKPLDVKAVAGGLVAKFNDALEKRDYKLLADLFVEDGYWRDHLALSWALHTLKGRDKMQGHLQQLPGTRLQRVEVDDSSAWRAPTLVNFSPSERQVVGMQVYTTLQLSDGTGRGLARLVERDGQWKIWTLFTTRESLAGHEEPSQRSRPVGVDHGGQPGRKNWLDRRTDEAEFGTAEPAVLIVGAGQAGLTVHARLKMLNVPALIVEANDRIGDNWRKRYHQLVLHDPVWYDHLPYLPFPEHWPVFTPKDKLAEWFECYAKALELNVWMRSAVTSSTWDDATQTWTVTVARTRPDGTAETRTLHPKHLIQATGHAGKKHMPAIPGRDTFAGLLCHSADFPGARPHDDDSGGGGGGRRRQKKAVVVGACNSSHDICQDLYEHGYDVTMVQRSTTCVVTSTAATDIMLGGLYAEGGPPVEDADLWLWAWPAEAFKTMQLDLTARQVAADKPLLQGLERAGFQLDYGPDDAGLFIKYLQRGGGYYFDVGASQLIIDGKIKVRQGQDVAAVVPQGVQLADGSVLEADEIVFATGFENMRTQCRLLFGDAVADRVGDVWGYDDEGEVRALWRDTGHAGFWFHGGNLALCRYYSRILALQIAARLDGLDK
ncbi:hypothetical protein P8C59_005796 [Phyllachora maydis]|uniref:FAD/NAD(P)-binding domain-containing protein n=1 Tax=Phyllachora maydis TaxID=1825666 RepID=A0AAD9I6Q5_9PEZI|nr:hypothetical protein P8C59_005796 [Phyllachora maydis]